MVAFGKPQEGNLHIKKLSEVVQQVGRPVSWAVFADNDPIMLRRLREVFKKEPAAIIPAPQILWNVGEFSLQDAAVWAVEELAITSLVIVGNSAAEDALSGPMLASQDGLGQVEQGPLASVRTAAKKRRLAEENFSQQVQALLNVPEVSVRLIRGSLDLHCLFYRAESGVFAAYDFRDSTFRELII